MQMINLLVPLCGDADNADLIKIFLCVGFIFGGSEGGRSFIN